MADNEDGYTENRAADERGGMDSSIKLRLEVGAFIVAVVTVLIGIGGLYVTVWNVGQSAKDAADAQSVARRADAYRTFLGAAGAFDIAAQRYAEIALANGRKVPSGAGEAEFSNLSDKYTRFAEAAWGVKFTESTGDVETDKEVLSRDVDRLFQALFAVHNGASLPEIVSSTQSIDATVTDGQNHFARAARCEIGLTLSDNSTEAPHIAPSPQQSPCPSRPPLSDNSFGSTFVAE
jgi:hypothetical protein